MKNWIVGAVAVAMMTALIPDVSEAKRLGGGKSSGMQRDMPARSAPDNTPAKPATPTNAATPGQTAPAAAAAPAAAGTAAAAAAGKRSWLGPVTALAAGVGLAALLSHFGLGEGVATFLMMALLAIAAVFLVRFLISRFAGGGARPALAGAGAGAGAGAAGGSKAATAWRPAEPMQRQADTPAWSSTPAAPSDAAGASSPAAATAAAPVVGVPADFDGEAFARIAKTIFIRMQAAHDRADLDDLRRFTTPELFANLKLDLLERQGENVTDVVQLDAEVLDVAREADGRQVVSVRFHGLVREARDDAAADFDEIWHLVKADDGPAWLIAGIQQR